MISPIREERLRRGLGVNEFAVLCNLSHGTISLVEHGILARLPTRLLAAMVRLGVDVDELQARHREFIEHCRRELAIEASRATERVK